MAGKLQKKGRVISFRISESYYERLKEEGVGENLEPNLLARKLVIKSLEGEDDFEWLLQRLSKLECRVMTAGIDMAYGIEKILQLIHGEHEEIEAWIEENIRCFSWEKEAKH